MTIPQLEQLTTDANLPATLQQAIGDETEAASAAQAAVLTVDAAQQEVARLHKLQGELHASSLDARARYSAAKRQMLEHVAAGRTVDETTALTRLKNAAARALDSLSFIATFALPAAEDNLYTARISEAELRADHLEAKACASRLALVVMSQVALRFDPGASIQFSGTDEQGKPTGSWSERTLAEVKTIRTNEVTQLREQLQALRQRATAEQENVSVGLFNS